METLREERPLFCFTHDKQEMVRQRLTLPLSMKPGHSISTYEELLEKVSALNYYNPTLKLLFRGQQKDYFNYKPDKGPVRSSLYPSILRALPVNKTQRAQEIKKRVSVLNQADSLLKEKLSIGYIHRHLLVRWAILQHYEVCDTPLLDLTDSLQVALSFAISDTANEGFLYVFGFHHQAGPISVSFESMTQVVDLAKICPPEVSRPHFQSAFLAADYPTAIYTDDLIERAPRVEANFACRLLTKFHLKEVNTWIGRNFNPITKDILFPDHRDRWYTSLAEIKETIAR